MKSSENINELALALSKAQSIMGHAAKDTKNPFFNSKYADLASVLDACKEPLTSNGLAVTQLQFQKENNSWVLKTILIHSSGQWIESETPILTNKNDAQGFGSGLTYARRYALAAIVGIAQDDDDANEASKKQNIEKPVYKNNNVKKENTEVVKDQSKIKNEAPISLQHQKELFDLSSQKGIKPSDIQNEMLKRFNVDKTSSLKIWQFEELIDGLNKLN